MVKPDVEACSYFYRKGKIWCLTHILESDYCEPETGQARSTVRRRMIPVFEELLGASVCVWWRVG